MEFVAAHIARVVIDERHDRQLVRVEASQGHLTMLIGQHEALSIDRGLQQESFPRPLTHDLISKLIEACGARLTSVRIHDERGGTYFAELVINDATGHQHHLDCRPSDALALHSRHPQVPLEINPELLEE